MPLYCHWPQLKMNVFDAAKYANEFETTFNFVLILLQM